MTVVPPRYTVEWGYSDLEGDAQPPDPSDFDVHFDFLIRFADVPPGPGHCEFFIFHVLSPSAAQRCGVGPAGRRGLLVTPAFSHAVCVAQVEQAVAQAFDRCADRDDAVSQLDTLYVRTARDFSAEFEPDLLPHEVVLALVHEAFNGVPRGDGVTLHQALVRDDYGGPQAEVEARLQDTETRWQDVPDADIAARPEYFHFLDDAGIRYYLPAEMSWALRHHEDDDALGRWQGLTPPRLLPIVAPRNVGRGRGDAFDVAALIARWQLTALQVQAVYRFLCFVTVRGGIGQGIDEDELPAMRRWREAAQLRP